MGPGSTKGCNITDTDIIHHPSHITHRETKRNIPAWPPQHNECLLVKKEAIDKEECLNCELCVSGKKAEIISAKCRKNNCKRRILTHCQETYERAIKAYLCERGEARCAGGWGCQHLDSDLEWQIWTYLDRAEMICRFGSLSLSWPQHSHSKWTRDGGDKIKISPPAIWGLNPCQTHHRLAPSLTT